MSRTHRDYCVLASRWFLQQSWCDLVCWELKYYRGFADVVALTSYTKRRDRRVVVCEIKRTRADLLADLRAKKMLKYEKGSSHCYLAATAEALMLHKRTKAEVLEDLKSRGLPPKWGILVLPESGEEIQCLRGARRTWSPTGPRITTLTRKIAKSYCHRVLGGSFSDD